MRGVVFVAMRWRTQVKLPGAWQWRFVLGNTSGVGRPDGGREVTAILIFFLVQNRGCVSWSLVYFFAASCVGYCDYSLAPGYSESVQDLVQARLSVSNEDTAAL